MTFTGHIYAEIVKTPLKVAVASAILVVIAVLAAVIVVQLQRADSATTALAPAAEVLRESSHVLDDAGDEAVVVVEFLDFECETCAALYPVVEDLREKYADRITYAVRYFPLPGHANSATAAVAAEAAAQQGRFEDMYHALLSRQAEWGDVTDSQAALFRSYADELGLDMVAYDEAVASSETLARVKQDYDDAIALGLTGTPSFFIDGKPLVLLEVDDIENAIEKALNAR